VSSVRRLTALAATLLVALGLGTVPAQAGLAVPVDCDGDPVVLRWDDLTYELRGTCGVVKVLADDVTVRMPTGRRVVVRGHRNTVVSKSLTTLVVRGRRHEVRPTSVQRLDVASRGSLVAVEGLLENARLGGRGATVRAERTSTLRVPGRHNTMRSRFGYDVTVGGNANRVRYRRLDALVVHGDDNLVRVRRGETSVRNDGHGNRIRVARRG